MNASEAFLKFCKKKGIKPNGQFAEENGYLFVEGYKVGHKTASDRVLKFQRMSKKASQMQLEEHTEVLEKFLRVYQAAIAVVKSEIADVAVHPCDENNEEVKAKKLPPLLSDLYEALKDVP